MSVVTVCAPAPCPEEKADLSSLLRKPARVGPTRFPPHLLSRTTLPGLQFRDCPLPWVRIELTSFQTSPPLNVTVLSGKWAKRASRMGLSRVLGWSCCYFPRAGTGPFALPPSDLWTGGRAAPGWVHRVHCVHPAVADDVSPQPTQAAPFCSLRILPALVLLLLWGPLVRNAGFSKQEGQDGGWGQVWPCR